MVASAWFLLVSLRGADPRALVELGLPYSPRWLTFSPSFYLSQYLVTQGNAPVVVTSLDHNLPAEKGGIELVTVHRPASTLPAHNLLAAALTPLGTLFLFSINALHPALESATFWSSLTGQTLLC